MISNEYWLGNLSRRRHPQSHSINIPSRRQPFSLAELTSSEWVSQSYLFSLRDWLLYIKSYLLSHGQ